MVGTRSVLLGALVVGLVVPGVSSAEMLGIDCINSSATYGTAARHRPSLGGCSLNVDGLEPTGWSAETGWFHTNPTLLDVILETDASGQVTRSHYRYAGGQFEIEFDLENDSTGERRFGLAVLPILSMDVFSDEGPDRGHVEFFATLGAGLLDASIADALGIGQNISGGTLSDPFLGRRPPNGSTYSDPFREAGEGGPTLLVQVPEPSLLMLAAVGVVAVRRRLRRPE